jgi:hypothetical protein
METIFEIKEYAESGNSPFAEWFNSLDDVTVRALTNMFADLKREILVRSKHFKKVCLN